jgi:hypothetical protein
LRRDIAKREAQIVDLQNRIEMDPAVGAMFERRKAGREARITRYREQIVRMRTEAEAMMADLRPQDMHWLNEPESAASDV